MTTILLGPQRFTTTLAPTVRSLALEGSVAMVNAGWEERETNDGELAGYLDGRGVNLRLYQRSVQLLAADRELRVAVLEHRARHDELRAFYGIRLQSACDAVQAVRRRTSWRGVGASADRSAVQAMRDVDDWFVYEVARLVEATAASEAVTQSTELARHRAEVADVLAGAAGVVIAGGHVGILMQTLRLFNVTLPASLPVIAWSAGAMAVCDPVLLFHDFAPHGVSTPEVHDRGLRRLPHVIALPHARRRLRVDDRGHMSLLAERFPSRHLLPLDDGTVVRFDSNGSAADQDELPANARVVLPDGTIGSLATAEPGGVGRGVVGRGVR